MQTELKTNKISSKRSFIRTITAAAVIYLLLMILTLSVIARSIYSSLKDSAADILKQTAR